MMATTAKARPTPAPIKLKGTIKSIKRAEGYGFITHEATGEDYFFHRSHIERDGGTPWDQLEEDQPVEFTPGEGPKGPRATEVRTL
jgi:CspA family cold shock protein